LLAKYIRLYDGAPVAYLTFDREGRILEANLAAARLLKSDRNRLLGRRFTSCVDPRDRPVFVSFLAGVFNHVEPAPCEVTLAVSRGMPSVVSLEAGLTESGHEAMIAATDVTVRRQSDRDGLILGKLESTGVLAGGIAHDFNNLLTALLLDIEYAGFLAPNGGELARRLADAKGLAWSAQTLTQRLSDFARGDQPRRVPMPLQDTISDAVRSALSASSVRADLELPAGLWAAEIDERQIGQVFRNLVSNAREAMPDGGVVVVRAENVTEPSGNGPASPQREWVQVKVIDHGAGIPEEVLPRIFDPYFSTKPRGVDKGMGLGLAICHTIVQRHGGTVTARSEVGVGTTFCLRLPAATPLQETPAGGLQDPDNA
jgi:signal transduction histidine kinase